MTPTETAIVAFIGALLTGIPGLILAINTARNASKKSELEGLQGVIKTMNEQVEAFQVQLDFYRDQIATLQTQVTNLQTENTQLREADNLLRAEKLQLSVELEAVRGENRALRCEVEKLRGENADLAAQKNYFEALVIELRGLVDQYKPKQETAVPAAT